MSIRRFAALCLVVACATAGVLAPGAIAQSPSPAPKTVANVRIPFPQDDGSLTPYTFELGYPLVTLIYDTLMWRDKEGIAQPWLATSVATSPDGKKVTLKLPDGVRWQDKAPLTSADVAFTFQYMADHPHPRFTPELKAVERVETPDPRTVAISLKYPSPGFVDQPLADMPIIPQHLWGNLPAGRQAPEGLAIGSGPYQLDRYLPGDNYQLEANSAYFRGPPTVQTLDIPFINDAGKTFGAFETGSVDMVPVSLPRDDVDRLAGIGIKIATGPYYLGTVLMFNLRTAPFDRLETRQSVAHSLDLKQITQLVGQATPATRGYLHPQSRFAPAQDLPAGGPLQKAAPAVDQAAGPGAPRSLAGISMEILAPDNDPIKLEAGRQVVLALKKTGASVELKRLSRQDLSKAVGEDGSPPTFQAAIWSAPPLASYDPDFLRRLFGSAPADATFNYAGYRSPAFDTAAEKVATTIDPPSRQNAITEALRLLSIDAPVVPLFFSDGAFAYRPSIYSGWNYIKGEGIFDKRSFLEPSQATPQRLAPSDSAAATPPSQPETGGIGFGWIALAFVVAAGAVVVVYFARNRG